MKILVLTGIFPPDIGGPATHLDFLLKELLPQGFDFTVLTFGEPRRQLPFPVHTVSKKTPKIFRSLWFIARSFWLARDAEIVYIQDLYTSGLAGLLIKKILRKKIVVRFVGDPAWEKAVSETYTSDDIITFQRKRYPLAIELRRFFRDRILRGADAIITVSQFLKELLNQWGISSSKVEVIYNAVPAAEMPAISRAEIRKQLGLSGRVIVSAARLVSWKGMAALISIAPELIKSFSDLKIFILGDGPEMSNLKKLVQELNLSEHVRLLGRVPHGEILKFLKAADVFVLNSNYEGFSHTLLEAMATGVPVVASNVGGNPETVRDGASGFLVSYNDKAGLTQAIGRLLSDADLRKRFAANANQVLEKFSWSALIQEYGRVFRTV